MNILFLDIETTPALADVWELFDQTVALSQLREPPGLLCFSAKWAGDDEAVFVSDHHEGREIMVKVAHLMLSQADIVVTWNGRRFDIPHLNREFVELGLKPPEPYRQVDLMQVVKRQFRFPSNKLQYVSTALGLEGKFPHEGHELWVKCMEGDPEAWGRMEAYNRQDVLLLEQLYGILLPWIPAHPSVAVARDGDCCPKCGSNHFQRRGWAYTQQSQYRRYRCNSCGAWFRSTKAEGRVSLREVANG